MKINSMQSILRKFHKWMDKNINSYSKEFFSAQNLFFGERYGLSAPSKSPHFLEVFNEWLITDFPVNGFVNPIKNRKNFLQYFLKEESKNLTEAEKIFGDNLQKSYRSFYHVENIEEGMWVELLDIFSGEKYQMWDVSTSKNVEKGDIIFARIVQNEKGKFIGGGVNSDIVSEPMFEILKEMILKTYGASSKSSFDEFMKWNSYIYIRDIYNPAGFLKSLF